MPGGSNISLHSLQRTINGVQTSEDKFCEVSAYEDFWNGKLIKPPDPYYDRHSNDYPNYYVFPWIKASRVCWFQILMTLRKPNGEMVDLPIQEHFDKNIPFKTPIVHDCCRNIICRM